MIILQCVATGGKLRIRFHSYVDEAGKIFSNVYDNSYNCQFPRAIRQEGRFFEIPDHDMSLHDSTASSPFYRVRKNNIRILSEEESEKFRGTKGEIAPTTIRPKKTDKVDKKQEDVPVVDMASFKVYEVIECVVCLSVESDVIFIPCAHRCVCHDCYNGIKNVKNACPLCRQRITKCIYKERD